MHYLKLLVAVALGCAIAAASAQSPLNTASNPTVAAPAKNVTITELSWIDNNKMGQEIAALNELTESKIGAPIRGDLSDLDTLQRLVDNNIVKPDDYKIQQAMGLALGNLILADFPSTFEWKIYQDELGRSRALCAKGTSDCLFPITMFSRRIEVGIKPDVKKIHKDAIAHMKKHLPKLPYDGGIMYKLPRK